MHVQKLFKIITALMSLLLTTLSIIVHSLARYVVTATNIYTIETAFWLLVFAQLSLAISYILRIKEEK